MNPAQQWYHRYEGWIAAVTLCAAMYGAGWISATVAISNQTAIVNARIDDQHRQTIASKDQIISLLATSTASSATQASTAATQAATATGNAATAASVANQAADSAATAAQAALESKKH